MRSLSSSFPHGLLQVPREVWNRLNMFPFTRRMIVIISTGSSAGTERLCDALCPPVVSLNKIIPLVESFIIVT